MNQELRIKGIIKKELSILENSYFMIHKGFTLIEMLIYMGIMAILLLVLTDILVSILDAKIESESSSSVEQDGRFILSRLSYDINRAGLIISPYSLGAIDSLLNIRVGGVAYNYAETSGNLYLTNNNGSDKLNSSETIVTDLSFQRIGNIGGRDTIKIQFTITSVAKRKAGPEIRNFQTTVGLR